MTDDENKPKRPNANYKLSKPDNVSIDEEEDLHFYYNRERRLAKAPQSVRDLYTEKRVYRFNLLKPLIADKRRAILFFTIIIICAMIYAMSMLGYFDDSYSLDGNKIEISGTKFENMAVVALRKTVKKDSGNAYSGAVDIAISPVAGGENEEIPIFYHRVYFTLDPVEEYHFVVPFYATELIMVLQTERRSINAKFKAE